MADGYRLDDLAHMWAIETTATGIKRHPLDDSERESEWLAEKTKRI